MKREEVVRVLGQVKFLPVPLRNLIYVNMASSCDLAGVSSLALAGIERTLDGDNVLLHCKLVLLYEHETGRGKFVFTMKFKEGALKSFSWTN